MAEHEPWGLSGPEFLRLYWIALAVVVAVVVFTAIRIRRPRPPIPGHLGVYDLALLSAGPLRVEETAMAGLLAAGTARVSRDGAVTAVHGGPAPADPVQAFVLDGVTRRRPSARPRTLGFGASPLGRQMIDNLAEHGYLTSYHRARRLRRVHWLFFALLAVCAVRAAAFLTVDTFDDTLSGAMAVTLIAWFVFRLVLGRARSRLTEHGREALRQARAHMPTRARGPQAVLGPVALYGVDAYPNGDLAQVMTLTPKKTTDSGSGCGSGCGIGSSDGSGSDGGGSDGGGSDGGGGCGGGGGD